MNSRKPAASKKPSNPGASYDRIALMLQGGGALGAYQVGVYKALAQANCMPDWVCGVSIGAVNGAIIAGNTPDKRVAKLEEFWSLVTRRAHWPQPPTSDAVRAWTSAASTWMTITMGQPGFFKPRLSVGAINVETGNNIFFDTQHERLTPEHIMASGALPPALPMVKIGNAHYWDGGIVSNTPLQYLLDQEEDKSALVFQVDLFNAKGTLPTNLQQVAARQKDIVYSSRTRHATTAFKRVPASRLRPGEAELMHDYADAGVINLVQLIYQSKPYESDTKDYDFSGELMQAHSQAGYADTLATLAHPDWLAKPSSHDGVVDHDVHRVPKA